ncbi:hypothetical protein O9929_24275 [Vibrio lentus]|nr:hypothetical protein [Vibrio lentus]
MPVAQVDYGERCIPIPNSSTASGRFQKTYILSGRAIVPIDKVKIDTNII